jgi:hypothetical protein
MHRAFEEMHFVALPVEDAFEAVAIAQRPVHG